MYPFSIGVMLDSFRTDVNTALDKAQAMGAQGVRGRPPLPPSPRKSAGSC